MTDCGDERAAVYDFINRLHSGIVVAIGKVGSSHQARVGPHFWVEQMPMWILELEHVGTARLRATGPRVGTDTTLNVHERVPVSYEQMESG